MRRKDWLLNLACLSFLCVTSLINVCSADPLLFKRAAPYPKKRSNFWSLSWFLNKEQNKDVQLNPIQAGGHMFPPPPLFLHYLWSNYNQTWHDSTLGQNLSKAIKILLTSSSRFQYRSRSKFEFSYLLSNEAEIWHRGQFWGADFEFEPKKSDISTFWKRKRLYFTKNWNFCPSTPWQKCCHGNTLGYC